MVGDLLTLPVRVSIRVTRFTVRTGLTFSVRALSAATDVVTSLTGRGANGTSDWPAPESPTRDADDEAAPPRRAADEEPAPPARDLEDEAEAPARDLGDEAEPPAGFADDDAEPPARTDAAIHPAAEPPAWSDEAPSPLVEEPAHVSEDPVLVEEFAEPGAEDGAGAEVRVDEPWDGYTHMTARDITARLGDANEAELAAVQLYESTHKQRDMVLSAVKRELRIKSAPGANG
jgi:hypothetical protein